MCNIFKKKPKVEITPLTKDEHEELISLRKEYLWIKKNNTYTKIFKRLYNNTNSIKNKIDKIKFVLSILFDEKRRHNRTQAYLKSRIESLEARDILDNRYYQEDLYNKIIQKMKENGTIPDLSVEELEQKLKYEMRSKEELVNLRSKSISMLRKDLSVDDALTIIKEIFYIDWLLKTNRL